MEKIIYNYLKTNLIIGGTSYLAIDIGISEQHFTTVYELIRHLDKIFHINNPTYLKPIINKWLMESSPDFRITTFWLPIREYPKHKKFRK